MDTSDSLSGLFEPVPLQSPVFGLSETILQSSSDTLSLSSCSSEASAFAPLEHSRLPEPKIVTLLHNGEENVELELDNEGVSYHELQECIKEEFNIPVRNQRISLMCNDTEPELLFHIDNKPLNLRHNDAILVENIPRVEMDLHFKPVPGKIDKSYFLWMLAKLCPGHFRRSGKYYALFSEEHELEDMLHFKIDDFPAKAFSYNSDGDNIELCVRNVGHFEIDSDVDERIQEVQEKIDGVKGFRLCSYGLFCRYMKEKSISERTVSTSQP